MIRRARSVLEEIPPGVAILREVGVPESFGEISFTDCHGRPLE